MDNINRYKQAVLNSTLLNQYEKASMLDGAQEFPEEFLSQMIVMLQAFDARSLERRKEYLAKISDAFKTYRETINKIQGLSEVTRKKYLEKADILEKAIVGQFTQA